MQWQAIISIWWYLQLSDYQLNMQYCLAVVQWYKVVVLLLYGIVFPSVCHVSSYCALASPWSGEVMFFVASLSPRYGPLRPAPKNLLFLFYFLFLPSTSSWVTGCYRAMRFHFGWLNRVVLSSSLPAPFSLTQRPCCNLLPGISSASGQQNSSGASTKSQDNIE